MQTEQEKLKEEFEKEFEGIFDDEDIYRNVVDFWLFKMTAQKQKMGEILEKQKQGANFIKGTYGQQRMKRIAQLKGYNACLSDIKQRMEDL